MVRMVNYGGFINVNRQKQKTCLNIVLNSGASTSMFTPKNDTQRGTYAIGSTDIVQLTAGQSTIKRLGNTQFPLVTQK